LDAILQEMQDLDQGSFPLNEAVNIPNVALRQYTIANFTSQVGYSGAGLFGVWAYYGFGSSELVNEGKDLLKDRYMYRTAGNVVKVGTVDAMQNGFEDEDDQFNFGLCDMAGKLMTAMYKVADGGFGDDRCLNFDGTSGTGAYLHIDNADGTEFIHINVIDSNPKEPVEELKERFLEWRKLNPCNSTCDNTSLRFKVAWNGKRIMRDCSWIGNKATIQRCKVEGVSAACPVTCDTCNTCADTSLRFKVAWNGKRIMRDCSWIGNKATIQRCKIEGVAEACPVTCGLCS